MSDLIAKFETDVTVRARVVQFVSAAMALVGVVAAVAVAYLSQVI